MRLKYKGMGHGQMVIVKPGPVSNFGSQYWDVVTKPHTARHRLLFYAKIVHEGLASETKRQASAQENKCQLSQFKQCDNCVFIG